MPERAIIPLLPALSLGFIAGIIVSALQLSSGPSLVIALCAAALSALAAVSSVFGVGGDPGEKAIVAAVRAACAAALSASMFLFITGFLREGRLSSLIWLVIGVALGLVLTQQRVRDRGEPEPQAD